MLHFYKLLLNSPQPIPVRPPPHHFNSYITFQGFPFWLVPVSGSCDDSLWSPKRSNLAVNLYGKCWGGQSWHCMLLQSNTHLRAFSWPGTVPGMGVTLRSGSQKVYVPEERERWEITWAVICTSEKSKQNDVQGCLGYEMYIVRASSSELVKFHLRRMRKSQWGRGLGERVVNWRSACERPSVRSELGMLKEVMEGQRGRGS